jgi:TonB family protein
MNSNKILLAATLAGGLLCSAVVASSAVVLSDLTISTAKDTMPVPTKIVNPTGISPGHRGEIVRLSLTIDESGLPHNVRFVSGRDPNLVQHLLPAVAQWKFTPAVKHGRPVATEVVLPIQLVDNLAL